MPTVIDILKLIPEFNNRDQLLADKREHINEVFSQYKQSHDIHYNTVLRHSQTFDKIYMANKPLFLNGRYGAIKTAVDVQPEKTISFKCSLKEVAISEALNDILSVAVVAGFQTFLAYLGNTFDKYILESALKHHSILGSQMELILMLPTPTYADNIVNKAILKQIPNNSTVFCLASQWDNSLSSLQIKIKEQASTAINFHGLSNFLT